MAPLMRPTKFPEIPVSLERNIIFKIIFIWILLILLCLLHIDKGFPGGSVVKNLPTNAGDMGSIPGKIK